MRALELSITAYRALEMAMPRRRTLIALAALAATFLVLVAVANAPSDIERGDGFKSEAAESVATGGATDKKAP